MKYCEECKCYHTWRERAKFSVDPFIILFLIGIIEVKLFFRKLFYGDDNIKEKI